jgi:hypothetical protein
MVHFLLFVLQVGIAAGKFFNPFRVQGSLLRPSALRATQGKQGLRFRVLGSGFWVLGSRFRVQRLHSIDTVYHIDQYSEYSTHPIG